MPKPSLRRVLLWVGLGALAIFVAIQFVPYGWWHSEGSMPPDNYTRIHRGTDLSEADVDTLVAALAQMSDSGGERGGDDGDRGRGGGDDGSEDHDGDDG
jgi:hypothetical protein